MVGIRSIDARDDVADRRVPVHGEGDVLIGHANELPAMMRTSLTWDQGSETAKHAALTLVTQMPVFFAHDRTPWERGTNEGTLGTCLDTYWDEHPVTEVLSLPDRAKIKEPDRENRDLRLKNDSLKEAAAYFGREQQ
jgi:hypothetical protein